MRFYHNVERFMETSGDMIAGGEALIYNLDLLKGGQKEVINEKKSLSML